MHRFFVGHTAISGSRAMLEGDVAHQIARVLRLRAGEKVVLLDGAGLEYELSLTDVHQGRVEGVVTAKRAAQGDAAVPVTLFAALLKGDKLDTVLQKCTELGVSAFVPFFSERMLPQDGGPAWAGKRRERWSRIVKEASEVSRRGRLPEVHGPVTFAEACEMAGASAIIPWEEEAARGLRTELAGNRERYARGVGILIGPEGGFTAAEVETAKGRGATPVTLGRRIMRADTASIAAVSAVMYELGELGS
ncbi:MAG: 16S rRNA (uracil(1498)-N(3))-methyltransferase [SAR202 cluster bacterium]|nr:16S rRNA (uracil(1498)-N(3))-methyltransferase [SAR202 cluster bacterium]